MPKRQGFFIRLLAALIDSAILIAAILVVSFASALFTSVGSPSDRVMGALVAATLLAYSTLDIFTAGSPGKLALGLTIANLDATPASRAVLSLRWSTKYFPLICTLLFVLTNFVLFRLLSGVSYLFVLIGCLYASCDHHQSWHDQWSRTAVFRRRHLTQPSPVPVPLHE